jgi:hypothetical protein
MKEQLLQFIWRFQYFNRPQLHTEAGEPLQILSPGEINTHQGPDFLNASVRIGDTFWVGNIELHIRTSDWKKHAHQKDKHYQNVILHVVWENDLPMEAGRGDMGSSDERGNRGSALAAERNIPLLVLQDRIPKLLLSKYEEWMNNRSFVACERQLPQVTEKTWSVWKRQLLEERLHRKLLFIQDCLEQNHQHWEETTWWLLARNFGFPVNTASFEAVARSLRLPLLARHKAEQLEALLLGQAGLLEEDFREEYPLFLQKEFRYLRKKYRLPVIHPSVLFLRMRPGNFPAIRLAQLAGLLSQSTSWFACIKEADSPRELKKLLAVTASPYWDTHYGWGSRRNSKAGDGPDKGEKSDAHQEAGEGNAGDKAVEGDGRCEGGKPRKLGEQMKESILINTFSPLLFAYGCLRGEPILRDKALRWLAAIPAEKNALVAGWGRQGVYSQHATDTQALLELKTRYCDPKKCLECAIGNFLLGSGGEGGG